MNSYVVIEVFDYKGGELSKSLGDCNMAAREVIEKMDDTVFDNALAMINEGKDLNEIRAYLDNNPIELDEYAGADGTVGTIFKADRANLVEVGFNGINQEVVEHLREFKKDYE